MPPQPASTSLLGVQDAQILLSHIKEISPKVFSYFQYDLFGVILCIVIFFLGLTPCIGFATISYNFKSGGTDPDTNENLRVLLFVAPTTFVFAVGFCIFRLTNRKYPWTKITFDFLEGSVTYKTGTGMRFLITSVCNLFCCGCFCFLSEDEIYLNGAVDEAFSLGLRRAMFSEIKEIGTGTRFLANKIEDTLYVVGLKIRRKRRRNDDEIIQQDDHHDLQKNLLSSTRRPPVRITVAGHRSKENADFYISEGDERESTKPVDDSSSSSLEKELVSSKPSSKSSNNSASRAIDDDQEKEEEERPAVNHDESDDDKDEDDDDEFDKNIFEEYIEMVPLDVVSSKENVIRTIKFWKRWMRMQYDSSTTTKTTNEVDVAAPVRVQMKTVTKLEEKDEEKVLNPLN